MGRYVHRDSLWCDDHYLEAWEESRWEQLSAALKRLVMSEISAGNRIFGIRCVVGDPSRLIVTMQRPSLARLRVDAAGLRSSRVGDVQPDVELAAVIEDVATGHKLAFPMSVRKPPAHRETRVRAHGDAREDSAATPLKEFLDRHGGPEPARGTLPSRSEWVDLVPFELRSGELSIGDSWSATLDGVVVNLAPGKYQISAKCLVYGADARVARLRVCRVASADLAELVGTFSVDVASAGVSDHGLMEAYAERDPDDFDAWLQAFYEFQSSVVEQCGIYPCPPADTVMVHTSCGFGDGSYVVHCLRFGGEVVGAEALFLQDDEGYFERPPESPSTGGLSRQ